MNTTYNKCELMSEQIRRTVVAALARDDHSTLSPALVHELAQAERKLALLEQRLAAAKAA